MLVFQGTYQTYYIAFGEFTRTSEIILRCFYMIYLVLNFLDREKLGCFEGTHKIDNSNISHTLSPSSKYNPNLLFNINECQNSEYHSNSGYAKTIKNLAKEPRSWIKLNAPDKKNDKRSTGSTDYLIIK